MCQIDDSLEDDSLDLFTTKTEVHQNQLRWKVLVSEYYWECEIHLRKFLRHKELETTINNKADGILQFHSDI